MAVTRRRPDKATRLAQQWLDALTGQGELDDLVSRAYPADTVEQSWELYRAEIARQGNPDGQIRRFEAARVILQPKQLELAAWARKMDSTVHIEGERGAPELGIGGARGPGKSFGLFAVVALDDCQRYPGAKFLYLRKIGKGAQEQIFDLAMAVLKHAPHELIHGVVRFPNGSRIITGHFRSEKEAMSYLGLQYDGIIIEETTTLSLAAYQALRNSLRTSDLNWRPRLYNSTNPLGVGHQWYKGRFIEHERRHEDVADRSRKFIFATVDDNHFVNADYVGNLEDMTGAAYRAYRQGDWDVSAGAYFDTWSYDRHVIPAIEQARRFNQVWASMDYGFNHWNVIYLHGEWDGVITTFAELAHRQHYPEDIAADYFEMVRRYGLRPGDVSEFSAGADVLARTGQAKNSIFEQYKALGIDIKMAETGPGSRVAGAHHMAKLLGKPGDDPHWLITEDCPGLIERLPSLERNPNNPEDVLKTNMAEDGHGGDDFYDAARYGLYRRERKPISVRTSQWA